MNAATEAWQGADELRRLLVPIESVQPHPRNPRIGNVDEIARSLERWGQVRAVLADPAGTIIAGNHTWKAAKQLGWTHIAVAVNEFDSEADARDYLLADNRLGDVGEYDRAELRLMLEDLERRGSWDGTGYQADDLELMRALEAEAAKPPPAAEPPPPPPDQPVAMREVILMFGQNDADLFARFGAHLKILRAEYGTEGVTETVARAVREAAVRANQNGVSDGIE